MVRFLAGLLSKLFAYVLLCLLIYTAYQILVIGWHGFVKSPKEIQATLITAVLGLAGVLYSKYLEQRRAILEAIRSKKVEAYEPYLREYFGVFWQMSDEDKREENERLIRDMNREFARNIIVWGSPDIIKAYGNQFRQQATQTTSFDMMETILRAIRKDLGLSNSGLERGDLIQVFVNEDVRPFLSGTQPTAVEEIGPEGNVAGSQI